MTKTIMILFAVVLLYSCSKDSCEECVEIECEDTFASQFTLVAGESVHDSLNYIEYNPIIEVKGLRYGTDSDYFFHDSIKIDLNFDGIDDIYFEYTQEFFQPSCDCEGLDCCMPSGSASCELRLLSNIEIAAKDYYGLNLNRLEYGDTISSNQTWGSAAETYLFAAWGMSESPWNTNHFNSFMGFRFIEPNDTLYGWLRMNTDYVERIEVYDYVIEKRKTDKN